MKGTASMESASTGYYDELALRAAQGDQAAFAEIYEYFFPRVYNFIFAKLKNVDATDDVISDVFIKVYQKLSLYDPTKASFSTWLFRLANNTFIDQTRIVQRRQEDTWEDFFDPSAPTSEEPEAKALAGEQAKELLLALDMLGERERRMIELKYWGGLGNVEIAKIMELSVSNVGTMLFRALGKLKKILESHEKRIS